MQTVGSVSKWLLFFRVLWIGVSILVLALSLYKFDGKPNSDIGIFLAWSMLFLGFPISFLVAAILAGLSFVVEMATSSPLPTSYWLLAFSWLCLFAAGYWQWFVILPRLLERLRKR